MLTGLFIKGPKPTRLKYSVQQDVAFRLMRYWSKEYSPFAIGYNTIELYFDIALVPSLQSSEVHTTIRQNIDGAEQL